MTGAAAFELLIDAAVLSLLMIAGAVAIAAVVGLSVRYRRSRERGFFKRVR